MSRQTIRSAVQTYLQSADITNLSTVYDFPPKLTKEGEFFDGQDPGHASGAVIYLWIERQSEKRIALGGFTNGRKFVTYNFVLDCYLRSNHQKAEDAGLDNDDFLDSLVTAIRANRIANAEGVVFSWGEGGEDGGTDIEIIAYYPKILMGAGSASQTYSQVRVTVTEVIDH